MPIETAPYELGGHLVTPRTTPVSFITGVVLAGGASSRMGQDKAALRLGPLTPLGELGPSLAYHLADTLAHALHAHNPEAAIWISCQADRVIPSSHAHLGRVHDTVQDAGPLAGITAALAAAKGPVFVLACDMPLMQSNILQQLISARQAALADNTRPKPLLMTTFQGKHSSRGHASSPSHDVALHHPPSIEPLVAIYEYAALPHLQGALQKKRFSLRRIIDQEALCVVPCALNQEEFFFNMNNPEEFHKATQLLLRHRMEA